MTLFSRKTIVPLVFFILITATFASALPAMAATYDCSSQSAIPQNQCQALVDFYNATDGDNWTTSTGWMAGTTPCDWQGVDCNGSNVSGIMLENNNLTGSVPTSFSDLSAIGSISLSGNNLSGTFPTAFLSLTGLTAFDISENNFSGSLPAGLGVLDNIIWFVIYGNSFSGSIPPEIGDMASLQYLRLQDNMLSGSIPSGLANATGLVELEIYTNQLSGSIPAELGSLPNLVYFYAGENQLSGTLPAELGSITTLQYISLTNNQLTGSIPTEFGALTALRRLDLSNNQFSGSIPVVLANAIYMEDLRLNTNLFSGTLPRELRDMDALEYLMLNNNQFTGNIPDEYGDLDSLRFLALNDNQFSGALNDVLTSTPIEFLYYQNTNFCTPQESTFQAWLAGLTDYTDSGITCPGKAILQSPEGKIFETDPTFTWTEAPDTDDYRVFITGAEGTIYNTWHSSSSVCAGGTCTFTRGEDLGVGIYTWMIQTRNSATSGPWSDGMQFRVSGAEPLTPSGTITDVTPTYIWDEFSGADEYRLFVSHAAVGTVVNEWYAEGPACMMGSCRATSDVHLMTGNHSWTFQAKSDDGFIDEWSTWQTFKLMNSTSPSDAIIPTSPNGGETTGVNPTFDWDAVDRASWYKVFIGSQTTGKVYNAYHRASEVCEGTTCTLTPEAYLISGIPAPNLEADTIHNWYVMPVNVGGNGSWSAAQNFQTEP